MSEACRYCFKHKKRERHAGKFIPEIGKKIYEENESGSPDVVLNLTGVGIGDGFMSPVDTAIHADFLYEVRMESGEREKKPLSKMEFSSSIAI